MISISASFCDYRTTGRPKGKGDYKEHYGARYYAVLILTWSNYVSRLVYQTPLSQLFAFILSID